MNTAQLLHSAGLRCTKARTVVLELLIHAGRPLSHLEIAGSSVTEGLDRVTLYRTLAVLQKAGLLHRVQGADGVWRFRGHNTLAVKCGGNHIHFHCFECKQMYCLIDQPLPWVSVPEGADVYGKQLVVYGRCTQCKSADTNTSASTNRTSGTAAE